MQFDLAVDHIAAAGQLIALRPCRFIYRTCHRGDLTASRDAPDADDLRAQIPFLLGMQAMLDRIRRSSGAPRQRYAAPTAPCARPTPCHLGRCRESVLRLVLETSVLRRFHRCCFTPHFGRLRATLGIGQRTNAYSCPGRRPLNESRRNSAVDLPGCHGCAFVRVIDAGSFSGAAKQLRVGQSTVSKTIAQLEDRLGVRLLLRSIMVST